MRRSIFVLFCVVTLVPAWASRAGAAKGQAASSSKASGATHSASATSKKTSTLKKKRHHTATKFVPKQKSPTSDRITEIQTALSHGGYYQGDPNGRWDSTTVAAMQKFQSANGIEASGKLDATSLQKLGLGSDIAGVSAPRPRAPAGAVPQSSAPSQNTAPISGSPTASIAVSGTTSAASITHSAGSLASKPSQQ
jgi:peptidoglycan hydrolase-like protein with peptidoglycan-binding domain